MSARSLQVKEFKQTLESNAARYQVEITPEAIERLSEFYHLLQTWNPRLHLVAPCSPQEFARRHVLESLFLIPHLPQSAKVADIGSGAGLPIVPCLIVRADINATLIEASSRKAVFLREALNLTGTSQSARVIAERFENVTPPAVGFVSCRALERFTRMLPQLIEWSAQASKLLLFGGEGLRKELLKAGLAFTGILIPDSKRRFLFLVTRT